MKYLSTDGFNNKEEYDANTDPCDPDDHPQKDNYKDPKSNNFDIVRVLFITIIIVFILLIIIMNLKKKKK